MFRRINLKYILARYIVNKLSVSCLSISLLKYKKFLSKIKNFEFNKLLYWPQIFAKHFKRRVEISEPKIVTDLYIGEHFE